MPSTATYSRYQAGMPMPRRIRVSGMARRKLIRSRSVAGSCVSRTGKRRSHQGQCKLKSQARTLGSYFKSVLPCCARHLLLPRGSVYPAPWYEPQSASERNNTPSIGSRHPSITADRSSCTRTGLMLTMRATSKRWRDGTPRGAPRLSRSKTQLRRDEPSRHHRAIVIISSSPSPTSQSPWREADPY